MCIRKRFSVLHRVHRDSAFTSWDDYNNLIEKLKPLVQKGIVTIEISKKRYSNLTDEEAWFRDQRTAIVFRLVKPDPPSSGYWGPVEEPDELSLLQTFYDGMELGPEQFSELVRKLDDAWTKGQIEHSEAPGAELDEVEGSMHALFYEPKSDETYHLMVHRKWPDLWDWMKPMWMKAYFAKKNGNWPPKGKTLSPPPWRTGKIDAKWLKR